MGQVLIASQRLPNKQVDKYDMVMSARSHNLGIEIAIDLQWGHASEFQNTPSTL